MVDPPPYSPVYNSSDASYDVIDETRVCCVQTDSKQPVDDFADSEKATFEQTVRSFVREELARALNEKQNVEPAAPLKQGTTKNRKGRYAVALLFVLAMASTAVYCCVPSSNSTPLASNSHHYASSLNSFIGNFVPDSSRIDSTDLSAAASKPTPSYASAHTSSPTSSTSSILVVTSTSTAASTTTTATPSTATPASNAVAVPRVRTHEVFHGAPSHSAGLYSQLQGSTTNASEMAGRHCIKAVNGKFLRAWRGPMNEWVHGELRADLAPHCKYNEQWSIEEYHGMVMLRTRFDGLHFYLSALPNGLIDFVPVDEKKDPHALWTPVERSNSYWSLQSIYGTYLSTIPSDYLQYESVDAYDLFRLENW